MSRLLAWLEAVFDRLFPHPPGEPVADDEGEQHRITPDGG